MFSDFYHSFYYVSLIISALTSVFLIKKVDAPNFFIAILILATLVSESVAKYISFYLKENSNIVYHVFVVVEYGLYCLIFSKLFVQLVFQRWLVVSFVLLFIGEVINTVFFSLYFFPIQTCWLLKPCFWWSGRFTFSNISGKISVKSRCLKSLNSGLQVPC